MDFQVVRIAALCAHRYPVEFVRTKGQSLGNVEAEILPSSLVPYAVPLSVINFEVRCMETSYSWQEKNSFFKDSQPRLTARR